MAERVMTKEKSTQNAMYNQRQNHLIWRKGTQTAAFLLLYLAALITIVALAFVISYVFRVGVPQLSWEFLTTDPKGGMSGEGGIASTIVTTLYLVGLVLLWAAPFGIGAGIFLMEYAEDTQNGSNPWVRRAVSIAHFGVETLAGVPSIIFGLFGYALFVSALHFGFSLLAASLAGACLVLPTIIRTTEEALRAVPQSYREASLALGATKWQTIQNVILPAAAPGIITGIILTIGRVIGETAVFFVTLGGSARIPQSILSSGRTMALHVYYLAMDTNAFEKAMATAVVLIVSIILINLLINVFTNKLQANLRGEK